MLPSVLLAYALRDGVARPHYLGARDEPWIRLLIDELDALVGRTRGDATHILSEKAAAIAKAHDVPVAAVRMVQQMLERLWRVRPSTRVSSREIRRIVFELSAEAATPRVEVIRRAANVLGIRAEQVSDGLFADSVTERRLSAPDEEPLPGAIVDRYNVALVQEFLLRTEQVTAYVGAHAAPALRAVKQKGLMYSFNIGQCGATLTIPGPVSLFRQTLRYGRLLASLLPVLTALPEWSLDAKCLIGAKIVRFHADATDPILTPPLRDTDNPVERRLFRDLRRVGSHWSITPAAAPVRAKGVTFFPDASFERGTDRVLLEIIRFHTAAYLQTRLEALTQVGLSSVVLCVDDEAACSERAAMIAPNIVHFRKRIEMGLLLRAIERVAADRDVAPDSDQPSSEC